MVAGLCAAGLRRKLTTSMDDGLWRRLPALAAAAAGSCASYVLPGLPPVGPCRCPALPSPSPACRLSAT